MNKSLMQKKFRFVMIIMALALFITIFTPAYIFYGKNDLGYPKVVWMWTILFGTGGGAKLNNAFNFSWIAFIGYMLAIILLIISLVRKFITIEGSEEQIKKGNVAVDAVCMISALLSLVMFILLPLTITKTSTVGNGGWLVNSHYGLGISFILAIIIALVMLVSSIIVLYAETIVKFNKIRNKNKKVETKAEAKVETKVENKEEKVEENTDGE